MTGWTEEETEGWKLVADRELEKFEASRGRLMEEHSAAFRWLMASLLALNGAGLLALKDMSPLHTWAGIIAGLSFYGGAGCALMVAVFGQRAAQAGIDFLSKHIAFWTAVRVTGDYKQAEHETATANAQAAIQISKRAPRVGWASFALFSVGLLFLAFTGLAPEKNEGNAGNKSPNLNTAVTTKND